MFRTLKSLILVVLVTLKGMSATVPIELPTGYHAFSHTGITYQDEGIADGTLFEVGTSGEWFTWFAASEADVAAVFMSQNPAETIIRIEGIVANGVEALTISRVLSSGEEIFDAEGVYGGQTLTVNGLEGGENDMTNTVSGIVGSVTGAFGDAFDPMVTLVVVAIGILIAIGWGKRFFGGKPHA